ncbi:SSU ribosomal protein S1p [Helicobacter heilmannii]|uniref:30S ribosomal protein S1 n=2 Tax=Helicobacter heilmannii TaxID=35817 RepID=UPI0006A10C19|nr:30S ribosomal protein S1 [Helicobacter heilmannii]CRF48060.1 SSU ribosomal protein S1p [Helicobacter heilmannii]CRF50080.1 SSU ribosomal protein S1p [Helicobacter heilmannii]CRF51411.1 SSU ribosomal protein S1p [Helicobacter heilmannii]
MNKELESLGSHSESKEFQDYMQEYMQAEEVEQKGALREGVVVSINEQEDYAMVSVGGKTEGRLPLSEIRDAQGELLFGVNDTIQVYVSQKGERPSVSYKRALAFVKNQEKIQSLGGDFKEKIVEGKVARENKGGYIVVDNEGVEYFLSKAQSSLKRDAKHIGKHIKACITAIDPENASIAISRKRFFDIYSKYQHEQSQKLVESGAIYTGVVKSVTSFGVFVEVEGVEGLVHYTEITHRGSTNPAKHFKEGDVVQVKALSYDEKKKRLLLSIKATMEDPWEEIQTKLKVGYAIKVVVSNIENYGVFVDIGNDIEGFLHISEISWNKDVKHPSDYLELNQEIDVKIIEIDSKNRRLRVSLKQLSDKPFNEFVSKHRVGDVIEGKVATLTNFGAFINLGGVDGLLHNKDAFWEQDQKCKDHFKVGDVVKTKILKIDKDNEKISLEMKYAKASPTETFSQKHKVGGIIEGKIVGMKDFGIFVSVEGVDVLIKAEDIYPLKKEELKMGDMVTSVVVAIEKGNNRVRASVRRLEHKREQDQLHAFNAKDSKMTLGDKIGGFSKKF